MFDISLPLLEVVMSLSRALLCSARIQLKLEVFQLGSARLGLYGFQAGLYLLDLADIDVFFIV